jgi:myo-inositol 2-dehydrogenase/D-chiro-inositol 1-dehydrogenase
LKLRNAVKAVEIGALLQEALVKGIQIRLNETGQRIPDAVASKL